MAHSLGEFVRQTYCDPLHTIIILRFAETEGIAAGRDAAEVVTFVLLADEDQLPR
jgi:hypothetical protein